MVHFILNIKACCLYVIWERQDQIWAKIVASSKICAPVHLWCFLHFWVMLAYCIVLQCEICFVYLRLLLSPHLALKPLSYWDGMACPIYVSCWKTSAVCQRTTAYNCMQRQYRLQSCDWSLRSSTQCPWLFRQSPTTIFFNFYPFDEHTFGSYSHNYHERYVDILF